MIWVNQTDLFIFNHAHYYIGTIVKIKREYQHTCRFNSTLKFTGYIISENVYCFSSIHNPWDVYRLSREQIDLYIDEIIKSGVGVDNQKTMDPKYIDGILSAWIWYIFIMVFAICFNGIENVILTWCAATFIFFNWRHKKIKGG